MAEDDVDFAVAAYRDDGHWQVVELHPSVAEDIDNLTDALGRFPSDVGVLGMVSMNDDFFVLVRKMGTQVRARMACDCVKRNGCSPPAVCRGSSHCSAAASGRVA